MKLKPLGDRVVVKPSEREEKTKSGIVLPETAKEEPQEGKVVAVGPGKWIDDKRIPLDVKEGDKIIYRKQYGSNKVDVDDEELLILGEDEILAVVT
ncbi:MAG TPA: co-chaperone GroES [Candidatus Subteraquimicrobiales bacterium]